MKKALRYENEEKTTFVNVTVFDSKPFVQKYEQIFFHKNGADPRDFSIEEGARGGYHK